MSQNRVSPPIARRPPAARAPRSAARPALKPGAPAGGLGPLTGLGVSLILLAACVLGSLLDLLLVGGPAWAVVALYVAACGYTAYRVRGADWYAALVAPPIAFAIAMIMLAELMPKAFGPGLLGLAATTFELLATKAKALYFGVALSAVVLSVRRLRHTGR